MMLPPLGVVLVPLVERPRKVIFKVLLDFGGWQGGSCWFEAEAINAKIVEFGVPKWNGLG